MSNARVYSVSPTGYTVVIELLEFNRRVCCNDRIHSIALQRQNAVGHMYLTIPIEDIIYKDKEFLGYLNVVDNW